MYVVTAQQLWVIITFYGPVCKIKGQTRSISTFALGAGQVNPSQPRLGPIPFRGKNEARQACSEQISSLSSTSVEFSDIATTQHFLSLISKSVLEH